MIGDRRQRGKRAGQLGAVAQERGSAAENGADHPLGGPRGLVEVDLLVHEESRQHERLERDDPFGAVDGERRRLFAARWGKGQRAQEPIEIVTTVRDAGGVRVAQEVVAAVDVEVPLTARAR